MAVPSALTQRCYVPLATVILLRQNAHEPEVRWFYEVAIAALSDNDDKHQVNIVMSKAYTLLGDGGRCMSLHSRMLLTIWLGYLTPVWQEAETIKFAACQEYLLHLCRGEPPDFNIELWLRKLQIRTAERTPVGGLSHLLDQLRQVDKPFGEYFRENRFEEIIKDPMVLLDQKTFMSFMTTGKKRSGSLRFKTQATRQFNPSQKAGEKSAIELETVRYFQKLDQDCATLNTILGVLDERIKTRRANIERYHKQIHDVSKKATCEHDDFSMALELLETMRAGEEHDMAAWLRLHAERQTMLITAGRLQCLLDIKKKSNNKNKNRNRSLKKKLQKDDQAEIVEEGAESGVVADTVVKVEKRGEAFVQQRDHDNVLQKTEEDVTPVDCGLSLDGAWEVERARANGRRAL